MKLHNPPKLKRGDTIGVVSPSAGLANLFPHRVEQGKRMLEKMGFEVVFARHALGKRNWTSASPVERAGDLHEMFLNKKITAIICSIGGNHSNQLLKYIDFDLVKENKKIFIGYSDITVLHYAFASRAGLRTFYGPCLLSEFGEHSEVLPYTLEYFNKALLYPSPIGTIQASETWTDEFLDWFSRKDLERPRKSNKSEGYEWWRPGSATGHMWGGAIPTVTYLVGTEYWIDIKDMIFFIDIPEGNVPGKQLDKSWLDAFLANLDNVGVFRDISGLIIGRPYGYNNKDKKELKKMIDYYTKDYSYPILYNANIGHVSPIITIPLGAKASINSSKNRFEILEPGVY